MKIKKAYEKYISHICVDQISHTSEQPVSSWYFYSMISQPSSTFQYHLRQTSLSESSSESSYCTSLAIVIH